MGASGSGRGLVKNLAYKAGLRYEYTNIQNQLTTFSSAQPSQSRSFDYQGVFPNVSLGYEINMNYAFNFSYRRGLSRPYYSQLNTFVKRTSALNISNFLKATFNEVAFLVFINIYRTNFNISCNFYPPFVLGQHFLNT